ncbi:MAG: Ig-like domain-containing protein, partial [Acidobacteria bacterium]|nr:Ig-like domain-containing protein [Acidobacteriota bacterium]
GNALAEFRSAFATAGATDTERPQVVSQRPGNGATNVALDARVVLYVNEPLDETTVAGSMHISQNGTLVSGTTQVVGNGQTIEFIPDLPWQHGALVQIIVDSAVRDRAGNALQTYQGSFRIVADPRTTAPFIVNTSPGSIIGVPLNAIIEIEFNEPLDPSTVNTSAVNLRQGTTPLSISVSLVREGRVIRIVPAQLLAANTTFIYQVVPSLVRDLDGVAWNSFFAHAFTTSDREATTRPSVVSVSPSDGATDIPINANISVRFDAPVNPLTVNGVSILLTDGANTAVPCTISFSSNNQDVRIVPHAPLAAGNLFSLTIEGVEDVAGNLVLPQTTQFSTGIEADTAAPQVVRVNPFSGATDVPLNVVYSVELTEPIDPVSISAESFRLRDNAVSLDVPGSFSVDSGGQVASLVPDAPLVVGRSHTGILSGIRDLAGNPVSFSSSFTTGFVEDTIPPQVVGVSPEDGLVEVPINAKVVIAFDEPIQTLSVDQVSLSAGGMTVGVLRSLSNGNRTLTLTPVVALASGTLHTLTIQGIADLAGNAQIGSVTASFTTGAGADLVRPAIAQVQPVSGATGVPTSTTVQITLSERINQLTVTDSTFFVETTTSPITRIAGSIVVAADGLSATFTPTTSLAFSTTYRVRAQNITDLTGQSITSFSSQFTTAVQ